MWYTFIPKSYLESLTPDIVYTIIYSGNSSLDNEMVL